MGANLDSAVLLGFRPVAVTLVVAIEPCAPVSLSGIGIAVRFITFLRLRGLVR